MKDDLDDDHPLVFNSNHDIMVDVTMPVHKRARPFYTHCKRTRPTPWKLKSSSIREKRILQNSHTLGRDTERTIA